MDQFELAEFAKNSENKEGSDFTPAVQEAGIEQGSLIVSRLYNTMLGSITRVLKNWSSEISTVLEEAGLTPSALSDEQLYNAILNLIDKHSYGCQIGDLIPNIGTTTPLGRVLCNGQRLMNCKDMFPDFYNYVVNSTPYKTVAEYNAQVSTYGQCGFCAVDGDDVIVPLITRPISGVSNLNQTGQAILDTMRPITGTAGVQDGLSGTGYRTGAFYTSAGNVRVDSGSSSGWGYSNLALDTARLGSRYNGTETRGKQVQYPYYIQVYSAASSSVANVAELVDILKYQNQVGITDIEETSGNIELASGGIYTLTINGVTTFTLPTPDDPNILNQILVQLHIAGASTINWGTDLYFNEPPVSDVGYYNVFWEYDPVQQKWVVGQILKV